MHDDLIAWKVSHLCVFLVMNVMNILQGPFVSFFTHANWCLRKFSKDELFWELRGWRASSCMLLSSLSAVVRPMKSA